MIRLTDGIKIANFQQDKKLSISWFPLHSSFQLECATIIFKRFERQLIVPCPQKTVKILTYWN